jgi:hypothetical protein
MVLPILWSYLYSIGLQTAKYRSMVSATVMYTEAHNVTGDIGYST